MTHDELLAAIKDVGKLPLSERSAAIKRLTDEFNRTAQPEELALRTARARRSYARLGGALLAIVLGMASCAYFFAPDSPPELRTAEGISVSTCERIQRRGCETGNVNDCALDCSPTAESMQKQIDWMQRQNAERSRSGR